MRSLAERIADVRRVVMAAQTVARGRGRLAAEIARTTGLSMQGVELALARHLEVAPSADDLVALVARAGHANAVHVILSANVFTAPLRAVALALAAAERVVVRPSRRDPIFSRALVAALADPRVCLDEDLDVTAIDDGEIHVYGRDETIAAVRRASRSGVLVRGHGAGMGIAVVSRAADVYEAARLVADDVVPFDQRGCLSPRVVFVEGGDARALGEALSQVLGDADGRVPRGALDDAERAEAARYIETVSFAGEAWRGAGHVVGLAERVIVPPAGRHVHVTPIANVADVGEALGDLARFVVAVGADDPAGAAPHVPKRARLSPLGAMQRPPLDGPVDLRADTE